MSEQITVKNIISYLKAFFNKSLIISTALVISACQSQPQTTQSKTLQPKRVNQLPTLQVRKSTDGVQDVTWQITHIHNKRALFFNQYPNFALNSATNLVSGHTGCNNRYGRYTYNFAQRRLDFDVMAGHNSCDKALAQEADLMDSMQRVKKFQFDGTNLYLLDEKGQRLIQAQRQR